MVSSESRECIVSPTNELRAAVSIIDMNNYNNQRSFDFDDEPGMIKLEMESNNGGRQRQRGKLQPISENTLNMFAILVAAGVATLTVIALVITFFVLALK